MKDAAPAEASVEVGPLADSLGFLLRLAQLRNFRSFYDAPELQGLRPGEYSVLAIIGRNPGIRQGLLAQTLFIKRAHMTKLVRGFAARGLVERRVPPGDRRSVELELTEAGRAFVARSAAAVEAHGQGRPAKMTAGEHAALKRLLRKYLNLTEPGDEP